MKKIKFVLVITILFVGLQTFSQSIVDGKYNSTFGPLSMTTEFDKEFPNGSIIYGDYRENGTISGYYADFQKEIKGTFFNGSSEGKYIFLLPFTISANKPIDAMNGFWGYNSVNKNSTNSGDQWNITSKTGTSIDIKNVTNVWSGTWNTTDGDMHLVQIGKNITGRYKGVGTVTAVYNPSTRILKGTFLNQNINKTGYIEFYFEGNAFKGKWGWTSAMTEGNWDGTKYIKNNKELSKMIVASNPSATNTSQNSNAQIKYQFTFCRIFDGETAGMRNAELYGFGGIRLYRVTNAERVEIKSFGNKPSKVFDRTENNPYSAGRYDFPANNVEFQREFFISKADLNNPNVDIEVEVYHHLKGKVIGSNYNYGYHKEILNIENITIETREVVKDIFFVGKNYSNGKWLEFNSNLDCSTLAIILKKY